MSCNTYNGIPCSTCEASLAGIDKITLFPFGSVYNYTYEDDNLNYISDYEFSTLGVELCATAESSLSEEITRGNTDIYNYTLRVTIPKMEWEKRAELFPMIRGKMTMIIKDNNGKCWIFGKNYPARIISYSASTGTESGDNFYDVSFVLTEKEPLKEIRCYDSTCAISIQGNEYRQSLLVIENASTYDFSGLYELLGDDITRGLTPLTPFDPTNWTNPLILATDTATMNSLLNPNGNSILNLFQYDSINDQVLIGIISTDTSYTFMTIGGQPINGVTSITLNLVTTLSTSLTGVVITVTDESLTVVYSEPLGGTVSGTGLSGIAENSFIEVSTLYPLGQTFNVEVTFDGDRCTFGSYEYVYEPSNECQLFNTYELYNGKHYEVVVDKMTKTPTYREITIVIGEYQFNLYNNYLDYHSSFTTLEGHILNSLAAYPDLNITNVVVTDGVKDWTLKFDSLDNDDLDFYVITRGDDTTTIGDAEIGAIRKFVSSRSTVLALQTIAPSDSYIYINNTTYGADLSGEYGLYPDVINMGVEEVPPYTNAITRSIGIEMNKYAETDIFDVSNISASCPDVLNSFTIDTCLDTIDYTQERTYLRYSLIADDLGDEIVFDTTFGTITVNLPSNITSANYPDFGDIMNTTVTGIFNANLQFDAVFGTFYLELFIAESEDITSVTSTLAGAFTEIEKYSEHRYKISNKQHPAIDMEYDIESYSGNNNFVGTIKDYIVKDERVDTQFIEFEYRTGTDEFEYTFSANLNGWTIEFFDLFPASLPPDYTETVLTGVFNDTISSFSTLMTVANISYIRFRNAYGYELIFEWNGSTDINIVIPVNYSILFKEVYGRYDDVRFLYTYGSPVVPPTIQRTSINCPNSDIDVMNFLMAAGIVDPVIEDALNDFVVTLKVNNIWDRFDAIYPFVGGTAFAHKFNLKNPLDSNSAYRLVFSGSWGHSATGIQNSGTGYAETFYNESVNAIQNDKHISVYSRTNIQGLFCDMGVYDGGTISTDIIPRYNSGGEKCFLRNSSSLGSFANTNSTGFYLNNRPNSTEIRSYRNNTLNVIAATSSATINGNYQIGCTYNTATANRQFYSYRELSFASIGRSFSDAEGLILYNAVQALQTALSR